MYDAPAVTIRRKVAKTISHRPVRTCTASLFMFSTMRKVLNIAMRIIEFLDFESKTWLFRSAVPHMEKHHLHVPCDVNI